MTSTHSIRPPKGVALAIAAVLILQLASCNNNDDDGSPDRDMPPEGALLDANQSRVSTTIRRTTNGVPHIQSQSLEGMAYGVGYVQAQDNVCLLAEQFVKARSERSRYFGPGENNSHVISDFSYKALHTLSGAELEYKQLSSESVALLNGFTAGYNRYVADTAPEDLPIQCNSAPWVKPIRPQDLQAVYRLVGRYASGDLFVENAALFAGVPPGVSIEPSLSMDSAMLEVDRSLRQQVSSTITSDAHNAVGPLKIKDSDYGSNAWGIGSELSENGKGALLANPHFPYTGARRFYQMHLSIPGYLNIHGAGLTGTVLPLIGFNDNLGWSHTNSDSRRFTLYELTLKEDDNLVYIKDGEEKSITVETFRIEVANGTPTPTMLERDFYYSEYGPMLPADKLTDGALAPWGNNRLAYTFRDANADMSSFLDTWLGMARASNLEEFQQVFKDCGNTRWTNTTYADDQGNAFYIDSSAVPALSADALSAISFKRSFSENYDIAFRSGLTLLDGNTSRDDWVPSKCGELVAYDERPKLVRADFVQNSNDSHWASNPEQFLTGFSPLFGPEGTELSARTRLGLTMVQNPLEAGFAASPPGGQDGKFSATDLVDVIYNNRSFYAETILSDLLGRCDLVGNALLPTASGERSVDQVCEVLKNWDGLYDVDSVGAHVFRLFMAMFSDNGFFAYAVDFDATNPVGTPSTAVASGDRGTRDDEMLLALANAANVLDLVSIPYDAALGNVQRIQKSGGVPPGGSPELLGDAIAWHGAMGSLDGGFNLVGASRNNVADDTLLPRIGLTTLPSTGDMAEASGVGWRIDRGTSWHFGLEFSDDGPVAYGLLSYAQSTDPASAYFNDQSERYSQKDYGMLYFTEADIAANVVIDGVLELEGERLMKQEQ